MGYKFRSKGKKTHEKFSDFLKYNQKEARIAVISLIIILAIYFVGSNVSGLVTYRENLVMQLNKTQEDLFKMIAERDSLQNDLQMRAQELGICSATLKENEQNIIKCEAEKNDIKKSSESTSQQFAACQNERTNFETLYNERAQTYRSLVLNTARMCCSSYDVHNEIVQFWNVTNNSIACYSGSYTLNCSSGQTNY
jgi:septal ring factor EnvC (AmiA/AmiB activator)